MTRDDVIKNLEKYHDPERKMFEIDDEWIKNRELHRKTAEEIGIISGAISTGLNLSGLSNFGISTTDNKSYFLLAKDDYNWLSIDTFFIPVTYPNSKESLFNELEIRGFENSDIQILEAYLRKFDFPTHYRIHINKERKIIAEEFISKYKTAKTSQEKSLLFEQSNEKFRESKFSFETYWIYNLYNSFDKRAKRILISYLEEKISNTQIIDNGLTVDQYEKEIEEYLNTNKK